MSTHIERATALAERIAARVSDVLAPLDREMDIMKWPNDFRVIMWDAVASYATRRARACDDEQQVTK